MTSSHEYCTQMLLYECYCIPKIAAPDSAMDIGVQLADLKLKQSSLSKHNPGFIQKFSQKMVWVFFCEWVFFHETPYFESGKVFQIV